MSSDGLAPAVAGKAIRIAPGRDGLPIADFWKFWVRQSEVYAACGGDPTHVSVHSSGEIHYRLIGKDRQRLAPLVPMGSGEWLHALELRFLVRPEANRPRIAKSRKQSFLIDVTSDTVLVLNLLIAMPEVDASVGPQKLGSPRPVWRARLSDARTAVLVARVLDMTEKFRKQMNFIDRELRPTVSVRRQPQHAYVEVRHFSWSLSGGNIIKIVPLGADHFRIDSPASNPGNDVANETLLISSAPASATIRAPDGAAVASLVFTPVTSEVSVRKGAPAQVTLGTFTVTLIAENLKRGESFRTESYKLPGTPAIQGVQPRIWGYRCVVSFDGETLTVTIQTSSVALRTANHPSAVPGLPEADEVSLRAPRETLTLTTTIDVPTNSIDVLGEVTWRSIIQ